MSEIDKATPGPWAAASGDMTVSGVVAASDGHHLIVCLPIEAPGERKRTGSKEEAAANRALIVAAVNAYRRASGEASEEAKALVKEFERSARKHEYHSQRDGARMELVAFREAQTALLAYIARLEASHSHPQPEPVP